MATHEPPEPTNWPTGHVSVARTDESETECLVVTIHGESHYLHATTARALANMLFLTLNQYNEDCEKAGVPGV